MQRELRQVIRLSSVGLRVVRLVQRERRIREVRRAHALREDAIQEAGARAALRHIDEQRRRAVGLRPARRRVGERAGALAELARVTLRQALGAARARHRTRQQGAEGHEALGEVGGGAQLERRVGRDGASQGGGGGICRGGISGISGDGDGGFSGGGICGGGTSRRGQGRGQGRRRLVLDPTEAT
eukprot:scaffold125841_cov54-Phaeocystis_antarctica.AAC.1